MLHKDRIKGLVLALMLIALLAVPVSCDDTGASKTLDCQGLSVVTYDDTVVTSAGEGHTVTVILTNTNVSGNISVRIALDEGDAPISMGIHDSEYTIEAGKYQQVTVSVSADRYAEHGEYSSSIGFMVYNHHTGASDTVSLQIHVTVKNTYTSEGSFNKILGVFENNLPYPLNTPTASAGITFAIWFAIALAVYLAAHIAVGRYFKEDEAACHEIRVRVGGLLILIISTFGLEQAALVYGANEFIMSTITDISGFIYTLLIAYIVWDIYKNTVRHVFSAAEKDKRIEAADTSLIPLFNMIGQLVIGIVAAAVIMSLFGFNLYGILTGAGIIGLAISLGAQNILTELFSGITLLTTRPFREGDMVRIGSDSDIYQVLKVRLMNSEFKNWASLEHMILPNSKISTAKVVNLTKNSSAYRLFLYYDVSYDSDLDKVKEILLETAYRHPQIIRGCPPYDDPGTRVTSFDNTTVQVRLTVYIYDFLDSVTVTDQLIELGYKNLEDNGVVIPYERMDVTFRLAEDDD